MAVAAYASLVSLTDVLENIQHPARHLDKERIQSLQQKVHFLQHFLELHSQKISPEMEDLARQLAVVADEADDIIDFHVVNQLRERSQDKTRHMAVLSSFRQDIDKIIKKIDSVTEKLMMVKEEGVDIQEQQPSIVSVPVGSTALPSSDKTTLVGFDERLLQVVDELTRDESDLRILPIVGMGGIGYEGIEENIVPGTISLLWDLQILKLDNLDTLSSPEIFEMPKLRHLSISGRFPDLQEGQDSIILENLSTLRISLGRDDNNWFFIANLEVLKLYFAFEGREWSPIDGEFLQLKVLIISGSTLEQWRAEDIHFPNLHGLYLKFMMNLKEIPLSIGDINTLHSIHLVQATESAVNSAVEIVKDQKEKGNESLQVYVNEKQVLLDSDGEPVFLRL
ncbi:UNVERIFIED_CONTAM: hypothetical protein Slati_3541400 [Sesamum latifolium]|uniref:Rx N-terminal domain-containing protein n=1 Tax=Sesamum latifolium TaxID=2727402 RepID=A0AAW2UJJ9_9LAMI